MLPATGRAPTPPLSQSVKFILKELAQPGDWLIPEYRAHVASNPQTDASLWLFKWPPEPFLSCFPTYKMGPSWIIWNDTARNE